MFQSWKFVCLFRVEYNKARFIDLGVNIYDIPNLKKLAFKEQRINSYINTYVAVHNQITTLHDLEQELCQSEKV